MRWPEVCVILVLVAGAVAASAMKQENLSMLLAGAAAGYATQARGARELNSHQKN